MSDPQADAVTSLPHAVLTSEPHADAVTSLPHAVLMSEPQAVAITFCAIFDEKNVSFSFHALNFMIFTLNFSIKVKNLYSIKISIQTHIKTVKLPAGNLKLINFKP